MNKQNSSLIKSLRNLINRGKSAIGIGGMRGFTLVEVLAVIGIFGFLTAFTVTLYPNSSVRLNISNIASDLQGDIRGAQLDASSVSSQQQTVAGYGIHFPTASKNGYQHFIDKVTSTEVNGILIGNQKYDGQNEDRKFVTFPEGYSVTNLCVNPSTINKPFITCRSNANVNDVTLLFKRPSALPMIYINNSTSTFYSAVCAQIEYKLSERGKGIVRSIILTKTGLIQNGIGGCLDGQMAVIPPPAIAISEIDVVGLGGSLVDIALDLAGNAYTASFSNNKVIKIDTSGISSVYGDIGYAPEGLAVDGSGTLYVLAKNGASGILVKFIPNGGTPLISTLTVPVNTVLNDKSMVIDSSGFIVVIDDSINKVWKIDPITGVSTSFADTQNNPKAVAIDSLDNIYVLNSNSVSKFDAVTGASLWNSPVGPNPTALDIDSLGNVFTANNGDNTVTKITQNGVSTLAFSTTGGNPEDLVVDAIDNIFTANRNTKDVSKITQAGASSIVASTGNNPLYMAAISTTIFVVNKSENTITKIVQ